MSVQLNTYEYIKLMVLALYFKYNTIFIIIIIII